ncbi:MAG: DUF4097 domain-containing protein [Oscillospiraceae bacterium]|jgi:lia operon protein LiaG|nr:DUF4097 domain-containing protein [Oscillospiraceae bacterium]
MKVWAVVFSCLFVISLAGLIISVGVTGVGIANIIESGNFYIGWSGNITGEPFEISKTFEETFDNIEIGVLIARANISVSPDGITRVNYEGNNTSIIFSAEINGDTLIVREKGAIFRRGWNWIWGWNSSRSALGIELPQEFYNKISIELTSGRLNGELPETDNLHVNITSGSVTLDYNHDNNANHLRSHSTSGNITINGFPSATYDIYLTSGSQQITGLSGSGNIRMTSGTARVDFAEWNGDLNLRITSGNANITVPRGSGADINFSRTSGSMKYDLDGDSGRLDRSGSVIAGGSNRQRVTADLTSGSASITN